ncbi:MAG: type III-A CRISPR-associated RAMP protein Csm3 [Gammaproteobacteria bacterium]|nr:MAG: type III-A CRISPR-associated RAMP protein Csm3 [Gammaproteobacteria bacterium]
MKSIRKIIGTIEVVTGLRIGGSADTMEISGLDNPIIRNPATGEPFIPGSSLRGKMRSLAEWYHHEVPKDGNVLNADPASKTARVFGVSADSHRANGPTRLIVRDAVLTPASREAYESGIPITEVKSENAINRLTAMPNPRPMERVIPGVTFQWELIYREFQLPTSTDDPALFEEVVLTSLALLEMDALGGGGSRGNGKIKLHLQENGTDLNLPQLQFS